MGVLEGHTPRPYNLHLGQHRLAEIAMHRLQEFPNATVRFGTRLQTLQQDAAGVTLTVRTGGAAETLRAKWSSVRTAPAARCVSSWAFHSMA